MKMILGIAAALIVGYLAWRWFAPAPSQPAVARAPTQRDSLSTVSDGEYQFTVASSQLTNDLDMAENVAKSDYTAQAQIAESIGRSVRQYEQQQLDAIAAAEKEKGQKKTGHKAPRRTPSPKPKR